MTIITLHGLSAALGIPAPLIRGTIAATRWASQGAPVLVSGADVVFPATVRVQLVDGEPAELLDLPPSTAEFCYKLTVSSLAGGTLGPWFVAVPEGGPVDVGDLVRVDPATFEPLPVEVSAAWDEALGQAQGAATAAADSAAAAALSVTPGLHVQSVAGVVTIPVVHEHTYELNATAAATVSLDGVLGCQAAIVWSGSAGTLEGTATADGQTYVAVRLTAGWKIFTVGGSGDTTAPTPGALSSSSITSTGFTLTATGASDAGVGLHAQPYRFSTDNGATWSAYQTSNVFVVTGKTASTVYTCKHQVQDAAGNVATGSSLGVTTASGGDVTPPTPGTVAGSAITSSGFTLTISGASDAGGLHAQPYAFSTDNGVTWSAYQASAVLAITGKAATTGYPCKGRVRDAAGNTADTPAQTVTTSAALSLKDQLLAFSPQYLYPLDEASGTTVANLGTAGGTAAINGTPTFGNAGMGGAARSLSFGTGGYANMGTRVAETASVVTIMCMVRLHTGSGAANSSFVGKNQDWAVGINQYGNVTGINVVKNAGATNIHGVTGTGAFLIGVVYNAGTSKVFVNGVLKETQTGLAASISDLHPAWPNGIGQGYGQASQDADLNYGFVLVGTALSDAQMLAAAQSAGVA